MTNEGSAAAARAVGMDVSKTTPPASTAGRRGRRNYTAVYGAKSRSPAPRTTLPHQGREITAQTLALVRRVGEQSDMTGALQRDREATLMPGPAAGHAARHDPTALAHEAP